MLPAPASKGCFHFACLFARISLIRTHDRIVIGHHLVMTLYGHWLSNDPRGSGSQEIRKDDLKDLGPILPGRQFPQPPKKAIKEFYQRANPLLDHNVFWIDSAKRQAMSDALAQVIARCRYTCWACAILRNHVHLLIRRHRDDAARMWDEFAHETAQALRAFENVGPEHPIWSDRPYKVFLYTPDDVRGQIEYIVRNPEKEQLPRQQWSFVLPYNGWPFEKKHP